MGEFEVVSARNSCRRIAVVGSGISGLAAAWLLSRQHAVTLFEADVRPGGHSYTIDVDVDGIVAPVDTGFLVFNRRTYPELCGLFATLDIPIAESEMTFSVSLADSGLEWAGNDLSTVFAQKRNLLRPGFWLMLRDILRFNREASDLAAHAGAGADETLGDFLARRHFGENFRNHYLLPMAAAIWSCPTQQMLAYPALTFVRFCNNHGLLQVEGRPKWLTIRGGSRVYVNRMLGDLPDVRLGTPIRQLIRDGGGVQLHYDGGNERFDEVVLACHSDQALRILGAAASEAERTLLGSIRYQSNRAVVHTDAGLLPRNRKVWSAWNYAAGAQGSGPHDRPVCVSYLLNRLQPLPFATPLVVSLNPIREPAASRLVAEIDYAHPVFDRAAIAAQCRLDEIQGVRNTWFCGAWTGYGFHEDGLRSALGVAQRLGMAPPWRTAFAAEAAAT